MKQVAKSKTPETKTFAFTPEMARDLLAVTTTVDGTYNLREQLKQLLSERENGGQR